jgi:hypothetical protein
MPPRLLFERKEDRMPTNKPMVGASPEVIAHHARRHGCGAVLDGIFCPCGDALAFVCPACDRAVFLAVKAGTWCPHAEELWEARP